MRGNREQKIYYTGLWIFLVGSLLFFITFLSLNRFVLPTSIWVMFLLLDVGFIVFIFIPQPGRVAPGPPSAGARKERWYPRNLEDIVEGRDDDDEEGMRAPVRTVSPVPLIPLVLLLALIFLAMPDHPKEDKWRRGESKKLEAVYQKASSRVTELEAVGRGVGADVLKVIGSQDLNSLHGSARAALIHRIDSISIAACLRLSPFHEIGVQVFTPSSERVAWGGRPRYLQEVPRGDYEARLFTSRTRMYTLLVNNMPLARECRVVVDIPLEANYRINNQFLRSTSLGEELSEKYGEEIQYSFSMGEHRGEMRWVDKRLDTLKVQVDYDSDEAVMVHGVVKASTGLPLAYLRVIGVPFTSVLEKRTERRALWGGLIVTLIVAVIALWVYRRYGKRGPVAAGRGWRMVRRLGVLLGFLILIRYLLLRLDLPGGLIGTSLFDPSFFADEAPFGLMRTTGDFIVTALFALMLVFGSIKVFRTCYEGYLERPLGGGGSFHKLRFAGKIVTLFLFLAASMMLTSSIVSRVVLNANPRLVGLDVQYLSLPVLSLHLALLFIVSAVFIVFLFLGRVVLVWGEGKRRETLYASVTVLVLFAVVVRPHWQLILAAAALIFLSARIFPLLKKEEIISIVLSSFFLVLICSLVIFSISSTRYTDLRESRVLEKAQDFNHPEDNWIEVVLPDICQEIASDRRVASKIISREESAAFEIWAESSFSRFNLSCILDAYDARGSVFSHFEVGIPFSTLPLAEEVADLEGNPVIRGDMEVTRNGTVYYYRGIVPVHSIRGEQVGAVVITVPYFFENTELLARTGPLAPEILQNIERGALAPRIDEPEDLLVARVEGRRVIESSSPLLVAGSRMPDREDGWFVLRLDRERYNCVMPIRSDNVGHLVGYRIAGFIENLLMWAIVVSLDVILTALSLLAVVVLRRFPVLGSVMPAISLGGRLGFREKVLLSFLAVSILPVLILGVFSSRFIQRSFQQEGEREAIEGVSEAVSLLDYSIRAEAESFAKNRYLEEILQGDRDEHDRGELPVQHDPSARGGPAARDATGSRAVPAGGEGSASRDIPAGKDVPADRDGTAASVVPPFGPSHFALLDSDGELVLDEGMEDFSDEEIRLLLDETTVNRVTITFTAPDLYGGVVVPVSASDTSGGYLYYRREIDDAFLEGVADVVGKNINIYFGGLLRASSQRELFIGGFIEPIVAPGVFADIALNESRAVVKEALLGDYSYRVASAPLTSISHEESGILSVPMLYQPSLIRSEVLKTSSLMLGLFALLFAATVTLAVFLAGKIFTPVAALIGGTRRIISGDLEFKLESNAPDEIGELVGSFNTMTAALREARRDLLERQRYLAAVLDNVATGVMATGGDGTIITLNPSGERILDIERGEVKGRRPEDVVHEGTEPLFALFSRESAGVHECEIDLYRGERRRTIKAVVTSLEGEGERLGTVVVFDDLTELIRSKKLSAWIEMARQIAHEVKNPLTPIKLSAQLMRRAYEEKSDKFDEIFESGVETVIQQTEILRRISSEFSSFGRVTRLRPEAVRLDPFLSEFVSSYRGAAGVEIVYERGDDVAVTADREALRKVMVNVMENALDAMPDGGTVTVRYRRAGETAVVEIRDTGTGLIPEVQERLYEPYFSTKTNGTGLGLAICQSLVREMDGEILLRNREDGRGVEVIVTLPLGE